VTGGSRLAEWEIGQVETSPFAWPVDLLKRIHGETTMGWTSFVVEMKDGSFFSYGTAFSYEFFSLPEGYSYQDIADIQSGVVYTPQKGIIPFGLTDLKDTKVFRERPYFKCFLDGLV